VQKVNAAERCSRPTRCRRRSTTPVKAGQDRERSATGRAYANDVVPRARGNAARLIEEANGYQTEVVQRADGDASRFPPDPNRVRKAPRVRAERPTST